MALTRAAVKSFRVLVEQSEVADSEIERLAQCASKDMFGDECDFDGFLLNHFPHVYQKVTNGWTRERKIELVLHSGTGVAVRALARYRPHAMKRWLDELEEVAEQNEDYREGRERGLRHDALVAFCEGRREARARRKA